MNTEQYVRKPFYVEAVAVTRENMAEIAAWCGGTILENESTTRYIKVAVIKPSNERQTQAFVGDWVVKSGKHFKCFVDKAFHGSFDLVKDSGVVVEQKFVEYNA